MNIIQKKNEWNYEKSVNKLKTLLNNGGREAFRKLQHYEKLLNGTNIYFIQSGKYIKIGEAVDIDKRLRQLQVGNPIKLKIIKIIKNAEIGDEIKLHEKLKKYHVRDEWYKIGVLNEI